MQSSAQRVRPVTRRWRRKWAPRLRHPIRQRCAHLPGPQPTKPAACHPPNSSPLPPVHIRHLPLPSQLLLLYIRLLPTSLNPPTHAQLSRLAHIQTPPTNTALPSRISILNDHCNSSKTNESPLDPSCSLSPSLRFLDRPFFVFVCLL
jgi:hypothetical protein